ncbi:MAG: peptide chain release factor N(5)-glutamine methyltransferase [Alphaproteobacteria bacterium]|nr:peptide chain release factor N(5)-glutamine methyltransferase [Alphaproteobacteria bacterium]
MHIEKYHQQLTRKLASNGSETADLDARLLICHFLQLGLTSFIMQQNRLLTKPELAKLQAAEAKALAHMPISRILQSRQFWGLDFTIDQHVLDPRADSEILIETLLHFRPPSFEPLKLLDLGTGSGCLLLALLHEYQSATGIGADFSAKALKIAQLNAKNLNLSNRASFIQSDWFTQIEAQKFDIILSNPPYIPHKDITSLADNVKLYDPLSALDGGKDGLAPYRIITRQAAQYLKPDGILIFEMGFDQADGLFDILQQQDFSSADFVMPNSDNHSKLMNGLGYDLAQNPRIIIAKPKS